ncbi:hypothetical protein PR202_ga16369 [Eleusine coracana subsp. coracana]|uniref:Late embryogenesis abundant protein LEA-2 subgroup domain-containing protein n=1 Tax=Eleusine coracana subsp. coracana TaxID=191504 RepID=A0AAV5CLF9_ELECO|nr:hypothetical protein PR202_ga16369 [Eleusine coracana subsp. coracana]
MAINKADVEVCCCILIVVTAAGMLIGAFAFVIPVVVTVDGATLGRLAVDGNNHTAASSLSYDVALVVAVHNHNWAMHVRPTALLDVELRFAGQAFHRVQLECREWIHPFGRVVFRFRATADESHPVELGSAAAAELARESAGGGGVFQIEVVVTGQFKYEAHYHRRRISVTCPLELGLSSTATAAPAEFVVSVRNSNKATRVWRTAPLDAELRLGGRPFALVRLADAETTDRIRPKTSMVYRVAAAARSSPVGSDGVAAFARDSALGVFRLELVVAGKFKYGTHAGIHSTTVRCPLKIPLSTSAKAVAYAAFEHALPPQPCVDFSNITKES